MAGTHGRGSLGSPLEARGHGGAGLIQQPTARQGRRLLRSWVHCPREVRARVIRLAKR